MNVRISVLSVVAVALLSQGGHAAAPRSPDCLALDKARKAKGDIQQQVSALNEEGKQRKEKCAGDQGCLQGLQGLRDQIAKLNSKAAPLNEDITRFSALCDEEAANVEKTIGLYESVAKENCRAGGDQRRCEDALFSLADIGYNRDNSENLAANEIYERAFKKWLDNDKQGKAPEQRMPSYNRGLTAYLRYLNTIPQSNRRDIVLYRTAFIYDLMGRASDAFPLLMEISTKYPASRQLAPTNLRIGEYHFVNRKYDSAVAYYNKVDANNAGNEGILGMALYHKAEALYQMARYQAGAEAFFDYLERIDKGQITRGALRMEAIQYLGSCFAEFPESFKDAKEFFKKRGGRSYEDTMFYELATKHADRDQFEPAIASLEYFLKNYEDYYKAPLAQMRLIEIWDKKKKIEEAQEAREALIQKFGRESSWWAKDRKIDKKELEMIQGKVRDAMLEVAMQQHWPGKDKNDTALVRKAVASYQRFVRSYEVDGNWPIYRAKIYMADALSYVGRHEEAADVYLWASKENVADPKKYREPTIAERKLTQPSDAGYNSVFELQLAANDEIRKNGNDTVKAYQSPVAKRYSTSVESYITNFEKTGKAVDTLAYNLFLYQVNGQDWSNAIVSGNRFLKKWPNFAPDLYNDALARLAFCYTQSGDYASAEKQYRALLPRLDKSGASDIKASMTANLGEVIWRMALASEKSKNTDSAVYHYRRLAREFSNLPVADSAAFAAAVALETAKRPREAAVEYIGFERTYRGKSPLAIQAILAAADQYRQARDTVAGVAILVDSLYRYYPNTPDSAAFKGISQAASLYDSAGRLADKAKTLEIYYTRYPKHDLTPAFLYTAGLTYEKTKDWSNAVRIYSLVVREYPKHPYAPEAAFSIPIIEEKQGNKAAMAATYESFAAQYPNDKSKVAKALLRAAWYNDSMGNVAKSDELYTKLTKFYATGDNNVQVDASFPAEAYYRMGQHRTAEANALTIGGTTDVSKITEQIKARLDLNKKADAMYDEAIKLLIEEWTIKSSIQRADNVNKILTDVLSIPAPKGDNLKAIQERILFRVGVNKGLVPALALKSAKEYESFLALANKVGLRDTAVARVTTSILRNYYVIGQAFEGSGKAVMEEPCPSQAKAGSDEYNEQCEYHRAQKEDREITFQKTAVERGYAPGIEKAAELGVVGPYLDSIIARVKFISPEDKSLQIQVVERKVDTTATPKVDKDLERAMERIASIANSDMDNQEKVRVLRSMVIEAQRQELDLQSAIGELKKSLPTKGK